MAKVLGLTILLIGFTALAADDNGSVVATLYFGKTAVVAGQNLAVVLEIENKGDKPITISKHPDLRLIQMPSDAVKAASPLTNNLEAIRPKDLLFCTIEIRLPAGAQRRHAMLSSDGGQVVIDAKSSYFEKVVLPKECFEVGACKIRVFVSTETNELAHSAESTIDCISKEDHGK